MQDHDTGSRHCQKCGQDFSAENPCCCSYASYDDGTHDDGYCRDCCACRHRRQGGPTDGIGGYERIDG